MTPQFYTYRNNVIFLGHYGGIMHTNLYNCVIHADLYYFIMNGVAFVEAVSPQYEDENCASLMVRANQVNTPSPELREAIRRAIQMLLPIN